MRYGDLKYLSLGEELDSKQYITCQYYFETDLPVVNAANAIAAEQSTGTWTKASTLSDDIFERLAARVTEIEDLGKKSVEGQVLNVARTTVNYPLEEFSIEVGHIPQVLSVIAGNLYGLLELKNVRLLNCRFPDSVIRKFPGPNFGIKGLRKVLDRPERPLVGTIVKPKIGLNPKETAEYVYKCGMGGLTNSKDDETLVDQSFNRIDERVPAIAEAIDRVREETGHRIVHALNVSTYVKDIVEIAERAVDNGASQIMVDVLTSGYSALQMLAEANLGVPLHVHRTFHGAFTRSPYHGMAMEVVSLLSRLSGGDGLHIGTFGVGKMHGDPKEDMASRNILINDIGLKTVMPVCSGGMHPGLVEKLVSISGMDVQIQAGGGVAGHPDGVLGGARAMSQAVDAVYKGISLDSYTEDHIELKKALDKWGYVPGPNHA